MSDDRETPKRLLIRQPLEIPTVDIPARFAHCDMIEVRVSITPLRWHEVEGHERELQRHGEGFYGAVQIANVEMRESRAVFHVVRQMLRQLAVKYLGLEDLF